MGFFINAQVIRSQFDGGTTINSLLAHVREAVVGAQEHQDLPFEQLVDALQQERRLNYMPLFQVLMNHQRRDYRELGRLPELTLQAYGIGEQSAKFELMLNTAENTDGNVHASLTYAMELFEPETIAQFSNHYLKVLAAVADLSHERIGDIELLREGESALLGQWKPDEAHHMSMALVDRRIDDQVRLVPDTAALHCGERLSYAQLKRRSERLARAASVAWE